MKPLLLLLFACLIVGKGVAQQGPQPGDVYREYALNLRSFDNWRVTDPLASHPGAGEFLPNPVISIHINDLDRAVKAEVLMDIWGGHPGTSGKKFRFNGNDWIDIPRVPTLEGKSHCYLKEYNVIVDLPLEYIHEGRNTFEGTSGGQVCRNFDWGQWGWYVMMVRVYYSADKVHTGGQISQPASGDTIQDDPVITVLPIDSGAVSSIQVLGNYYGYDENGDGLFKDWHRAYHGREITGHIGTIWEAPFQHTWNTRYVPDQEEGAVSFLARIQDTSGIWYVSEVVENITLQRPDSLKVRMYRPEIILDNFWVRAGDTKHCMIPVGNNGQAMEAILFHRTWNAGDDEAAGGTIRKPLRVNGHAYKCFGKNHFFALSAVQIAVGDLQEGLNKIAYTSNTQSHGIEILWPGPALVVRHVSGGDTVAKPLFTPPDGHTFQGVLHPTIASGTPGSKLYYTTDGSDPNPSDQLYHGQTIHVDRDMTIKARAFKKDCYESELATAIYTMEATGKEPYRQAGLKIYPNPVAGQLKVILGNEFVKDASIQLFDCTGRMVLGLKSTGTAHSIDMGSLSPGLYLIKVSSGGKCMLRSIIKK
jgi:hypothetical protein